MKSCTGYGPWISVGAIDQLARCVIVVYPESVVGGCGGHTAIAHHLGADEALGASLLELPAIALLDEGHHLLLGEEREVQLGVVGDVVDTLLGVEVRIRRSGGRPS